MKEAKKRNPDVITYGLPWGSPGWIDHQTGYYGPDQITYQVNWLKCARDWHGIDVTWLGIPTACVPCLEFPNERL
jgi:hypothetical protein